MALFPKVGRKQVSVRIGWWSVVAILCLGVLLHLLPFYFMITLSFKSGLEAVAVPPTLWPQQPTLAGWTLVLSAATSATADLGLTGSNGIQPFYVYLLNSLFMTFGALLISLPMTAFAAYATSKLQRGPAARWTFLFFIGTLMVPFAVTLLPKLLLAENFPFAFTNVPTVPGSNDLFPTIPILDTPWAVILPAGFNAFSFLLFKGYFDTIPNSILQAARVDGGSEFNIFRRIVLPMSIPVIAVAAWTQFSGIWDDFLWPLMAFQSPEKLPTSVAIYNVMNSLMQVGTTDIHSMVQSEEMKRAIASGLSWNGLMVLGLLQTTPIFIMFLVCRRYLLSGVRIRGLR